MQSSVGNELTGVTLCIQLRQWCAMFKVVDDWSAFQTVEQKAVLGFDVGRLWCATCATDLLHTFRVVGLLCSSLQVLLLHCGLANCQQIRKLARGGIVGWCLLCVCKLLSNCALGVTGQHVVGVTASWGTVLTTIGQQRD